MKSLSNYIGEAYLDEKGELQFTDAEKAAMDAEQDLHTCSMLQVLTSNWYHYAYLHLNGENKQKFNAKVITEYRKWLKSCIDGEDAPASAEIKSLAEDMFSELKGVTSKDFAKTMKVIMSFVPRIKVATEDARKAVKDTGTALHNEIEKNKKEN